MALITAGMEGELRLWRQGADFVSWKLGAKVDVAPPGAVLLECVAMQRIAGNTALVAVGGTNRRVWLFSAVLGEDPCLRKAAVLDGHRDWIRGLAFSATTEEGAFRLASASKDGTARIWQVQRIGEKEPDTFDVHTARVEALLSDEKWSFTAEALLDEHTAAVHSVEFGGPSNTSKLLTSSMDCSIVLWSLEGRRWESVARFGLLGGSSAHALGFFGASFVNAKCDEVLGHNFAGALHCWRAKSLIDSNVEFLAKSAPSGHFGMVTDLAWEPQGRYLLTCSEDKTARIFAEVEEDDCHRFVEWARPQVHGHALFAVQFCDKDGRKYVSGAEERMLRMFEAPSRFRLPGETDVNVYGSKRATSAVVPELGLSNKATYEAEKEDDAKEEDDEGSKSTNAVSEDLLVTSFGAARAKSIVPLEEDLKQKRLWPETAKLYGHGNEISCVAADPNNAVLASACKAQTAKDAVIILWDSNNGVECGRLLAHDLTINQMTFSEDGKAISAVSRDRSVSIFRKTEVGSRFGFSTAIQKKGAHSRLIYTCAWLFGDEFIATGGRDKYLKVFTTGLPSQDGGMSEVYKQKFDSGVSALDAVSIAGDGRHVVVAAGFVAGHIRLFEAEIDAHGSLSIEQVYSTNLQTRCGSRITNIQWRPESSIQEAGILNIQLGVASEDLSVRVLEFRFARGA
ncbi:unnamed protein product [Chondrus crispus]|uniref:Elongator complex protein 2 n=1 Tax=Chondrus crispus TaxID=2769 RepID=R7Q856_CHOCR|nr:unnamed protein product [Chondrus crispus]CDF34732.1 unnamed protein product [Chondrus crispus]|eukprot:XP_005714551.1 unnamed protein product [Chondrus crispus]